MTEISEKYSIPQENLLSPEILKRVIFNSGKEEVMSYSESQVSEIRFKLRELGARNWQVDIVADAVARAKSESLPPPVAVDPAEESDSETAG